MNPSKIFFVEAILNFLKYANEACSILGYDLKNWSHFGLRSTQLVIFEFVIKLKLKLGNTIISLIFLWSAHVRLYVRNGFGVFYVVFKAKIDIYKIYNYYYHHQKICLIPMLLLNFHNFHSYLSLLWSITFFYLASYAQNYCRLYWRSIAVLS